jgi:hypothetical protein
MVYKSHGIYILRFILQGFKDEGLYKPHVSIHQDYVFELYMLGAGLEFRSYRVKFIEVIMIWDYTFIWITVYIDYKC